MDTKRCEICHSKKNPLPDPKKTFLTRFPLDEVRCYQWVAATGNKSLAYWSIDMLHQLKLCSKHFLPEDFIENKTKLRSTAVPHLDISDKPLTNGIMMEDHDYCSYANMESSQLGDDNMDCDQSEDEYECDEEISSDKSDIYYDDDISNSSDVNDESNSIDDINKSELLDNDKQSIVDNDGKSDLSDNDEANILNNGDNSYTSDKNAESDILDDNQSNSPLRLDNCNESDEIDILFKSYAGSFKKLSNKLQTRLKLDIAKLFARYEIKNLYENTIETSSIDSNTSNSKIKKSTISPTEVPTSKRNTSQMKTSLNINRPELKRSTTPIHKTSRPNKPEMEEYITVPSTVDDAAVGIRPRDQPYIVPKLRKIEQGTSSSQHESLTMSRSDLSAIDQQLNDVEETHSSPLKTSHEDLTPNLTTKVQITSQKNFTAT